MTPEIKFMISWFAGSIIGYFLSRRVWKEFVSGEIGHDDNIFITVFALVFSWFLVVGSVLSILIHFSMSGINDKEAYWFGKKGEEMIEEDEEWNRSKRI